MKKILLLSTLMLGLLGATQQAKAQMGIDVFFSDSSFVPPSYPICSGSAYNVWLGSYFPTMPAAGDAGVIDIDWGDGTTTSLPILFSGSPGSASFSPNQLTHTYATGSYTATFIYADDAGNDDTVTWNLNASPYCGTVYTNVMLDQDGNGTGDIVVPNGQVDFTDGASSVTTYTVPANTVLSNVDVAGAPYVVSVNPAWLAANNYIAYTPPQTLTFSGGPFAQLGNFVVQCDPTAPASQVDLGITYMFGWGFRAGMNTGYLSIKVCNLTCSGSQNYDLDIAFDPLLTVSSHNIPGGTVSGNTISGNITTSDCNTFTVYFAVPGAAAAGTPLSFSANVDVQGATDYDLSNNAQTLNSQVQNSWDPNDKSVNRPQVVSPSQLDEFTYMIRFQNMGNDDAFNIVVKDTLDNDLDLSTFNLLELSHYGTVNVDQVTRIATFNFQNINLPAASVNEPASHGYAIYKIKENVGLPIGSEIKNTAYIYFDFNPPIITNTTLNVNQTSGVDEAVLGAFSAYPVPASEYFVVSSKNNAALGSIKLVDVTGKTVFAATTGQSTYTVDVKALAGGVYSLVVQSDAGSYNQKVIVGK